jgi:hypothetical protein
MSIVNGMDLDNPWTFIRCWDTGANKELKLRVKRRFVNADECQRFIRNHFRRLEYKEHAPWDDKDHGGGLLYAIPKHNVMFGAPIANAPMPDRVRKQVLIQRGGMPRRTIV